MDTTVSFFEEAPQARQAVNTGVDLVVYDEWGRPHSHPLLFDRFCIGNRHEGFEPDLLLEDSLDPRIRIVLKWADGQLFLSNESSQLQVHVNQQLSGQRELFDGDWVTVSSLRFRVLGLRAPVATLEGYSPPHRGQRWLLEAGRNALGRKGQRLNQVELEDPTVSRSHATLVITEFGATLEAETRSSQSKVNGQPVEVGQGVAVADSDLIQLGRQIFRLRLLAQSQSQARGLGSQVAVLNLQVTCSQPWLERAHHYLELFNWLWSQPVPAGIRQLPYDGQSLVFVALGHEAGHDLVDLLIDFAWQLRSQWPLDKPLRGNLAIHAQTADQQPPEARFAAIRRCLEVTHGLCQLAQGDEQVRLVISRAAWEASQRVTSTQRIGKTQILGDETPIEAYSVETL